MAYIKQFTTRLWAVDTENQTKNSSKCLLMLFQFVYFNTLIILMPIIRLHFTSPFLLSVNNFLKHWHNPRTINLYWVLCVHATLRLSNEHYARSRSLLDFNITGYYNPVSKYLFQYSKIPQYYNNFRKVIGNAAQSYSFALCKNISIKVWKGKIIKM